MFCFAKDPPAAGLFCLRAVCTYNVSQLYTAARGSYYEGITRRQTAVSPCNKEASCPESAR
ncbi:hypothetical protein RDSD_000864 [Oleidesulfovibrio alaskensis]